VAGPRAEDGVFPCGSHDSAWRAFNATFDVQEGALAIRHVRCVLHLPAAVAVPSAFLTSVRPRIHDFFAQHSVSGLRATLMAFT